MRYETSLDGKMFIENIEHPGTSIKIILSRNEVYRRIEAMQKFLEEPPTQEPAEHE